MPSKTIKFAYQSNGVAADVLFVALKDPTNAFGMRKVSDNTVTVEAGTPLVDMPGLGNYALTVDNLTAGEQYEYWLEWTTASGADRRQRFFIIPAGDPQSAYTTYPKFLRRWTVKNVTEATGQDIKRLLPDTAAVQDSFTYADDEINSAFLGSIYKSPFDFTPWGGVVPAKVAEWANVIAFAYCYDTRGFQEKNTIRNKIAALLQKTYVEMQLYAGGSRQLNAVTQTASNGSPMTLETAAARAPRWHRPIDGVAVFW